MIQISEKGNITGRYGYWVTNNNLKANVLASGNHGYSRPNASTLERVGESMPLSKIHDLSEAQKTQIPTLKSLELLGADVKSSMHK